MNPLLECCQPPMQHIHYHVCGDVVVNVHSAMELLNPEASLSRKTWMPGYGSTNCLGCVLIWCHPEAMTKQQDCKGLCLLRGLLGVGVSSLHRRGRKRGHPPT